MRASIENVPSEMSPAAVRAALARDGYAYVEGLDPSADFGALLTDYLGLGSLIVQPHGQLDYAVHAEETSRTLSSSKSTNALNPHTEACHYHIPPRYVALVCVRQARCGGGYTDFSQVCRELMTLDAPLLARLKEPRSFSVDPVRQTETIAPILETDDRGRIVRFRYSENFFLYGDREAALHGEEQCPVIAEPWLQDFCRRVGDWHRKNKISIKLKDHSLLVFDNNLVHARSSFTDARRHLIRYWLG